MAGARPYRTDMPPRRYAFRLSPAVRVLVIAVTALFILIAFAKPVRPLIQEWGAMTTAFFSGRVWQPITAPFLHFDVLSWLMAVIGLWFMGTFLETTQGRLRFLESLLVPAVAANVAEALIPGFGVTYGLGNGIIALFVVNARLFGRTEQQVWGGLFLQARHLAWLVVGLSVVAQALSMNLAGIVGTLVASGVGYALALEGITDLWHRMRRARVRRRYQVLEGGREAKPRKKLLN